MPSSSPTVPGLLLTPQQVHFSSSVGYATWVGGGYTLSVSEARVIAAGTVAIAIAIAIAIAGTGTGNVLSGLYAGHEVVQTTVVAAPDVLQCPAPPGVTKTSGDVTLVILPL
nr:hypothetical protein StreXyl84_06140 [Streptomyces sp. Xyl84]